MSKRIVVNAGLLETRVAVQEGSLLTELYLERLGDPLFVRTASGMKPTPLAERLAAPVRDALGLVDQALAAQRAEGVAEANERVTGLDAVADLARAIER